MTSGAHKSRLCSGSTRPNLYRPGMLESCRPVRRDSKQKSQTSRKRLRYLPFDQPGRSCVSSPRCPLNFLHLSYTSGLINRDRVLPNINSPKHLLLVSIPQSCNFKPRAQHFHPFVSSSILFNTTRFLSTSCSFRALTIFLLKSFKLLCVDISFLE